MTLAVDRPSATLRIRSYGKYDIEIECAGCGLRLRQALRAPIAERCPKCKRKWKR
jgi:predicted Zn-ribbon and HTH transcriptional regulator